VAESNEPATAESLGWQLRSALPPMRLHSVSLYNAEADCLWLSEGALGPDEHNVVIEAIEDQKKEKTQQYFEYGMEDGRIAVFLPIRSPRGELSGTVMILADMKSLSDGMMEKIVTPQVRTILVKIAMFMRRNAPASNDTSQEIQMPAQMAAVEVIPSSTTVIEKLPSADAAALAKEAAQTLGPHEVDQILELELVAEPPRPEPAPTPPPAAKAAPAAAAKNARQASALSAAPPASAKASPAAAKGNSKAAAAAPSPATPARGEVEVLQFDAEFAVPVVKPAPAPAALPEGDVLTFEPDFAVPPAKATVAQGGSAALSPAATASVAPAGATSTTNRVLPAGSTSTTNRALSPGSTSTSNRALPTSATPAPSPTAKVATVTAPPPAAPPVLSAAPAAKAPAPAARATPSSTQTAAVPVIQDDDDIGLIQDTGQHPSLDETTTIEPAPQLPPLEPLSVEESATDLTLFAQELIKLRSSGRTRRYEVLARSQRDANRNEVPAAFVAETARGKDGAALDLLVLERLLDWLGKHGEAIWDSEPASFSVNLSIGAIEDETFLPRVQEWMEKNSVPPEYVGFEITEFACVQCKPAVQRFIETVEKMGCFLVIDNFSFDSTIFEFLGSKALRHVKLDPKLTDAAMRDKLPQALVVAILQACKVLGVHCVAKKVESKSSMQWLTAVGCDFAQAFSLHKPLPLDALASGQPIKALRE
jgi:EAL domain-containing protein (putative c-di-GMP-specific phosphodiesterase class I)